MTTLLQPRVSRVLDTLFADAERADAPIMAELRALAPDARDALMKDYVRLYGAAKHAYLPVSREVGRFLYAQARARGARTIVEFGTSFGISTLHLAAALRDNGGGRLVTSELEPEKAERARANLELAGLADLVEVRVGDALSTLRSVPPGIDLLYLDGAKTLYRDVLALCEPSLSDRALVLADNIDMEKLVLPYTSYVRDPDNGYLSNRVAFAEALEVSLRIAA